MTTEQIIAILGALAGLLGAWMEHRRLGLSERIARVEERCAALERRS